MHAHLGSETDDDDNRGQRPSLSLHANRDGDIALSRGYGMQRGRLRAGHCRGGRVDDGADEVCHALSACKHALGAGDAGGMEPGFGNGIGIDGTTG